MITIFTVPKAFEGHVGTIQRNAIGSWLRVHPECQVVLCGNDPGVAEVASQLGVDHIPDVEVNEYGTPLLDSVFARSASIARHHLLCYINADVIARPDLFRAALEMTFDQFLLVGQRWDVPVTEPIDFANTRWFDELMELTRDRGQLHPPAGSDYFLFPAHSPLVHLPAFAVGRPAWDNWMIYRAKTLGVPVVDCSEAVLMIHQNHDYGHVFQSTDGFYNGPEGDRNRELAVGTQALLLCDADFVLTREGLRRL